MPIHTNDGDLSGFSRRATSLGAISAGQLDPYAPKEVNHAIDIGKSLLLGAMGPAGYVVDLVAAKAMDIAVDEKNKPHLMQGIKILSERSVPGFEHKIIDVEGVPVQIAVDASALIQNPEAKPYTLTDAIKPDHKDVQTTITALSNKAINGALEFAQDVEMKNSEYAGISEQYEKDLQKHLDALQAGEAQVGKGPGDRPVPPIDAPTQMFIQINKAVAEVQKDNERAVSSPVATVATPVASVDAPVSP
jgi:hypothetical protein